MIIIRKFATCTRAVLRYLEALGPPGCWGPYHPYGPHGGVGAVVHRTCESGNRHLGPS